MLLRYWQLMVARILIMVVRRFTSFDVHGIENLRNVQKPLIITPNHKSMIDSFLVGAAIITKRPDLAPLYFMTKDRLFTYPFLNFFIWSLGAFRANKKKGLERSLRTPHRLLRDGAAVFVFPEAHIVPDRTKLGQGRKGAAVLASATGVPLLPVSFFTSEHLTLGNFLIGKSRLVVRIGPSFWIGGINPRHLEEELEKATNTIMDEIADLYRQDEPQLKWRE